MMKWLAHLTALLFIHSVTQNCLAISVPWKNCDEPWNQPTGYWPVGRVPNNSCPRFDSAATITDPGTPRTVIGTESCCENCYKSASESGRVEPPCTGDSEKTGQMTASVINFTT